MTLSFTAVEVFQLIFYILLLIYVIHASVFSYHWLSFGSERTASLLGITVYLLSGGLMLLIMASSLFLM